MVLIKSISGMRGTIGGMPNENLTPLDTVRFVAAYATWILQESSSHSLKKQPFIVVGRDARVSGSIVNGIVTNTLLSMGVHVIQCGLSTTPSIEMAVINKKAAGGIVITASHNPTEWNALKLLNYKGEFISAADGASILSIAKKEKFIFSTIDKIGQEILYNEAIKDHVNAILALPLVKKKLIQLRKFTIVADVINSTGEIALKELFRQLGITKYILLNTNLSGQFAHNPEPLPEYLTLLSKQSKKHKAIGIAVDPDVDRLCFYAEDGTPFGEEYTLVAVADYILSHKKGNTVSNLSSTRALKDITISYKGSYQASAVGEVNVVEKMKATKAIIGGEGNGGIIYPELHYGRDALVGIALFLSFLAEQKINIISLKKKYPAYEMSKNKITLKKEIPLSVYMAHIKEKYKNYPIDTTDGLKIEKEKGWIHIRASNTEPIIRIYTESHTKKKADILAKEIMTIINTLV